MEGRERSLLTGGNLTQNQKYKHGFSSSQMESLTAICEALIPSIPLPSIQESHDNHKALSSYYISSASQPPFPDQTAELIVKRGLPKAVLVVKAVLKLLSTRLGTLSLCGGACFDWKWPFIHKFTELSIEKREAILQKWSGGRFLLPFRTVFFLLKVNCFYTYFSLTDEKWQNLAWGAIGYHVEEVERSTESEKERPLDKGIIQTEDAADEDSLKQSRINQALFSAVNFGSAPSAEYSNLHGWIYKSCHFLSPV